MSAACKLKQSRAQWKRKAGQRAEQNRYLRKELRRIKAERDRCKQSAQQAQAQLAARQSPTPVASKVDVVLIALQLFLVARIGFRAVARVLAVLGPALGVGKAPCAQTIINWVTRLSLARIDCPPQRLGAPVNGDRFANGFIWIIDTSIGLGAGKILTVLALDAHHHQHQPGAPSLACVQCIGVSVAPSWSGASIAAWLQKLIGVRGRPVAFLKDGGTDLAKALRVLGERGFTSPSIDDLSHVIANVLKHEYAEHPLLARFLAACGKVSQRLKQTLLACLAPPKTSTKARFMNLHRLVRWADRLLQHCPPGGAGQGSALTKLRTSLDQLPACKSFISRFLRDATPLLACQQLLKRQGLSEQTSRQCETFIEALPADSSVRLGFTAWLDQQRHLARTLGLAEIGLPISSDPIESLFGLAKQHGVGEVKDAHHIALHLPALCGPLTRADAQRVLEISVAEQQALTGSFSSLTQQRRAVLPHPGTLETLAGPDAKQAFELMPGSGPKNRSKNTKIYELSNHYEKSHGPLSDAEISTHFPLSSPPTGPPIAG